MTKRIPISQEEAGVAEHAIASRSVQGTKLAHTDQIRGFHNRRWQEGPPPWWMKEHRDMQDATYFKSKAKELS